MGNLVQFMAGTGDGQPDHLQELRLGSDPAMVHLFTSETTDVGMHFVDDPSVKANVICPGKGCPVCHLGSAPTQTMLLPTYEIGSKTIRVLRVTMTRKPGSLAACLQPHVAGGQTSARLLAITRHDYRYAVVAHQVATTADRGDDVIKDFLNVAYREALVKSAFRQMSAEELAEVPVIANKLASLGTWQPPARQIDGEGQQA
jgi:hypothetical protein